MRVVTLSLLTNTLSRLLQIGREDANKYAQIVMNFFGYEDCIIDNLLTPQERRLFYRLERHGILSSIREETTLYNGNPWRIHYWRLEREKILDGMNGKKQEQPKGIEQQYEDLYANIPKDAWIERHYSNA